MFFLTGSSPPLLFLTSWHTGGWLRATQDFMFGLEIQLDKL
jgi:hypothetical protein